MDDLVCPDCGHDTFEQTRTARIEYLLAYSVQFQAWYETHEEIVDGGNLSDSPIACADCGRETEGDAELSEPEGVIE